MLNGVATAWLIVAGFFTYGRLRNRYQLVELIVALRRPRVYVTDMDRILSEADFTLPLHRAGVLRDVGKMVLSKDVIDSCVAVLDRSFNTQALGEHARLRQQWQMKAAGIREQSLAEAGGAPIHEFVEGDCCLIGLVFTANGLLTMPSGDLFEADQARRKLSESRPDAANSVYLYYAPDPGQHLDEAKTRDMFRTLHPRYGLPPISAASRAAIILAGALVTLIPPILLAALSIAVSARHP
jgi:hypothetical protein